MYGVGEACMGICGSSVHGRPHLEASYALNMSAFCHQLTALQASPIDMGNIETVPFKPPIPYHNSWLCPS
ncbi:hypothetical protein V6N12_041980 [Hibiscus sabdariffa]|uniref:Uncharacterized protein n=1 Tax=Hibiscus sabdariffa TaxID=183260 RepID=A0ABR2EDF4_9ROSI